LPRAEFLRLYRRHEHSVETRTIRTADAVTGRGEAYTARDAGSRRPCHHEEECRVTDRSDRDDDGLTPAQADLVRRVMEAAPGLSRSEAIAALREAGM
jgi:hypothetical protein